MDRDIKTYLHDILQSISEVESYFDGKPKLYQEYIGDIRTKRAIERNIEIIGEATNRILRVDANFEIKNAQKIIGARNRIAHGYDKISDDMVWNIVINHLPKLKEEVCEKLEKEFENSSDEKALLLSEIKEAVQELNLIKQGKAQGRPARELLNEL